MTPARSAWQGSSSADQVEVIAARIVLPSIDERGDTRVVLDLTEDIEPAKPGDENDMVAHGGDLDVRVLVQEQQG
jgi:hypothetical protein